MNDFETALVSPGKNSLIPEEDNWFGPLVGTWDIEWVDGHGTEHERHVKGEWIFSWVLEGMAVQDVFICPSREARKIKTWPDAAYGTTIRIYNPQQRTWDIFYGVAGEATRLEARKEGSRIVLTEITGQKMKWIFPNLRKIRSIGETWPRRTGRTGSSRGKRSPPDVSRTRLFIGMAEPRRLSLSAPFQARLKGFSLPSLLSGK